MGRISRLEVENFKSFGGRQVIAFREFSCVIGPNGCGKSNLIDAICFAMGLHAKQLRGEQMKDLVWHTLGKDGEITSAAKSATVKVVYVVDDGEMDGVDGDQEVVFSRTISSTGATQYKIDGKEYSWDAYSKVLEEINIVTKARNFLVFQGDVEGLASKTSRDLLAHFEAFCGSGDLK